MCIRDRLITELPKGDWAFTVGRQFFFSAFAEDLYTALLHCGDHQIEAIAEKSLKEVRYHVRWSAEWVIRLGDGTEESHRRMQHAIDELMPYTGEMFSPADFEKALPVSAEKLHENWNEKISAVLDRASISTRKNVFMQSGGKNGVHTEHMGFLLAELQYVQRAMPGLEW